MEKNIRRTGGKQKIYIVASTVKNLGKNLKIEHFSINYCILFILNKIY